VVAEVTGTILELPVSVDEVNFDNAPEGLCVMWRWQQCELCTNWLRGLKLERATVLSGGLGVTEEDGDSKITEESEVIAGGTFVNGDYVRVYGRAKVSNINVIPAQSILPDFSYNNKNTTNDQDVDVNESETLVLTESVYGDIDVDEGATITFSGQEFVFIEELDLGSNVTILFDQCTNLIIDEKLSIGKYNTFNPGEENVFVFVEDDAEVKKSSFFYGGVYTFEDLWIRKADEEARITMYGLFIREEVKARDYVELSATNMVPCQSNVIGGIPYSFVPQEEELEEEEVMLLLYDVGLVVYPNPSKKTANYQKQGIRHALPSFNMTYP
jgi:hypothetical protein